MPPVIGSNPSQGEFKPVEQVAVLTQDMLSQEIRINRTVDEVGRHHDACLGLT